MVLAEQYLVAGRNDEALRMMEAAVDARDPRLTWMTLRHPSFQLLADDPRFVAVQRRVGLEGR
jgi:hypothetical protein